ncbi:MAG TPA: MFS transporter, partial [Spongiibacteraceae bacterium]|nr:MFS transporter [Spongiibacteraceae bacterium]
MNLKLPTLRWYYGWNVIAMALLFQSLCIGVSYFCFPLWVVPFSDEFGVSRSHIMFAIAASQVVSGLISPFGGYALDRLPPHWVISGGAITFILGLILIATAQSIWQIIFALLIPLPIGLVLSGVMAAQTLATRWFTKGRGVAIALATIGSSIGGFTMPPLAAALMTAYGWRTAIAAFTVAIALLIAASWRVLRKKPPHEEPELNVSNESAPIPVPTWRTSDLLRNVNFQTIILTFLPLMFAFNAVQMNLGAYAEDLGLTQQDAAFMVAQYSLFSLIGRILFGKLIDRYDHSLLYRAIAIGLLASLAIVIGAGLVGGANGGTLLKIGIALMGFISSGYMPLNSIVIANKFG